jgi:uncharacterized repeat protein (TIGR03803 family)
MLKRNVPSGQLPQALLIGFVMLVTQTMFGQTYNIIHNFAGPDGTAPSGGVVADATGSLYGTTAVGGSGGGYGNGTVYKLTKINGSWSETVIHNFQGTDGAGTAVPPTLDASGNVFATTPQCSSGCDGTAVELAPQQDGTWIETVLHAFTGSPDGSLPSYGLTLDASTGTLYGATEEGGNEGFGTMYILSGADYSHYSRAYSFGTPSVKSAGYPSGGTLARDTAGNLYGTANDFSSTAVIFKLSQTQQGGWTQTILYRFTNTQNGSNPVGGVILDDNGNLYGATYSGGPYQGNYGVIYRLSPNGDGSWTYAVLYAFQGGADGSFGASTPTLDTSGNLYGTTQYGGSGYNGTVFKLTPTVQGPWIKTTLHNFGRLDGLVPQLSKLWVTSQGTIYGTTVSGGVFGKGIVFQITQ